MFWIGLNLLNWFFNFSFLFILIHFFELVYPLHHLHIDDIIVSSLVFFFQTQQTPTSTRSFLSLLFSWSFLSSHKYIALLFFSSFYFVTITVMMMILVPNWIDHSSFTTTNNSVLFVQLVKLSFFDVDS